MNSCGKVGYPNPGWARAVLRIARQRRQWAGGWGDVYRCRTCGEYHLTGKG